MRACVCIGRASVAVFRGERFGCVSATRVSQINASAPRVRAACVLVCACVPVRERWHFMQIFASTRDDQCVPLRAYFFHTSCSLNMCGAE